MDFPRNSLEHINKLIVENEIEKAMGMLNRIADKSPNYQNARAVCAMRSGKAEEAVRILSPVVYPGGTVVINSAVPDKIKLNLAEAMFLAGNIAGGISLIENSKEESEHRRKLEETFKKWKQSLPLVKRFWVYLGLLPYNKGIFIDYPLGEL